MTMYFLGCRLFELATHNFRRKDRPKESRTATIRKPPRLSMIHFSDDIEAMRLPVSPVFPYYNATRMLYCGSD